VQRDGARVYAAGWAYDPETTGAIDVHVIYDGAQSFQANSGLHRPDVGAALLPGYGPAHGFEFAMDAPAGLHTLCAVAINVGEGSNALLGCGNVVVK
jgi:hypothetical protein